MSVIYSVSCNKRLKNKINYVNKIIDIIKKYSSQITIREAIKIFQYKKETLNLKELSISEINIMNCLYDNELSFKIYTPIEILGKSNKKDCKSFRISIKVYKCEDDYYILSLNNYNLYSCYNNLFYMIDQLYDVKRIIKLIIKLIPTE